MRLKGLPPVFDHRTRALIVGTFPSQQSLARGEYYANRTNQFWTVVGKAIQFGPSFTALAYPQRIAALVAARIGIWDVVSSCERQGSLDREIRKPHFNDMDAFTDRAPALTHLFFNGSKAAGYFGTSKKLETSVLPSTSSANTHQSASAKAAIWASALHPLLRE